ncbi:MAG: DUF1289 domain-containing protein [Pseudomonadota bacterium]
MASPCIGVCRLDPNARLCLGCGRSGDEIMRWRDFDDGERADVVSGLAVRLSAFDTLHVPRRTSAAEIGHGVAKALRERDGTFVVGCLGAVGEFFARPHDEVVVSQRGDRVEAAVAGGRFRLTVAPELVLLEAPAIQGDVPAPTIIAAPCEAPARSCWLLPLGPDPNPIVLESGASGDEVLFDLGLGVAAVRFMVRTGDPVLVARLEALAGASLATVLSDAGAMLVETGPTRVVESPLARIEVDTPIPPAGGRTPEGPHTHLMPGPLAIGRVLPPGVACPPGLLPMALHYPSRTAAR